MKISSKISASINMVARGKMAAINKTRGNKEANWIGEKKNFLWEGIFYGARRG